MSLISPYVPAIPQGNQQINSTQQPIKNNFQDIYDLLAVNHVPFNTANDFGKHKFVSYYNQSSAPGAATNQMVMFSQQVNNGFGLYYQYPNSTVVNLLSSNLPADSGTVPGGNGAGQINISNVGSAGYQYLTGPILMMFGNVTLTSIPSNITNYSGTQIFSYTGVWGLNVSFVNTPFHIEIIPQLVSTLGVPSTSYPRSTGVVQASIIDNLTFSITISNSSSDTFYVMVIGV